MDLLRSFNSRVEAFNAIVEIYQWRLVLNDDFILHSKTEPNTENIIGVRTALCVFHQLPVFGQVRADGRKALFNVHPLDDLLDYGHFCDCCGQAGIIKFPNRDNLVLEGAEVCAGGVVVQLFGPPII